MANCDSFTRIIIVLARQPSSPAISRIALYNDDDPTESSSTIILIAWQAVGHPADAGKQSDDRLSILSAVSDLLVGKIVVR